MADSETPVSPVRAIKPELTLTAPAVNEGAPVELDSTPASPDRIRTARRGSKEEITPEEKNRRAQLHAQRENDPAVLVDIDTTIPGTEEAEFASKQDDETEQTAEKNPVAKPSDGGAS